MPLRIAQGHLPIASLRRFNAVGFTRRREEREGDFLGDVGNEPAI